MKLIILFALFGLTFAAVFQHQLIRIESRKARMIKEGTWKAYKMAKSATQSLKDYDDIEYLAGITVGTPPQYFRILLDTGSSDFWIPDNSCQDSRVCRNVFDSNASSTFVSNEDAPQWHIEYGDGGYARGFVGEDTVGFFEDEEEVLVVPNSFIGQAYEISSEFANLPADGILGLAFPSIDTQNADPILFNAFSQGLLDKPIFTVYLEERGPVEDVVGGVITYGGLDTEHCSPDVDYVNLTSATQYQFTVDSVSMGSVNFSDGWQVISDTGTTMIYMPQNIRDQFAVIAGVNDDGSTINCTAKFDDLKLVIGGKEYVIPAKQLILNYSNDKCEFGIESGNENDVWILGDAWMRSYCNVFGFQDQNIGFAKIIA